MFKIKPAAKCLFAIALTIFASCSVSEQSLKIADDGKRTLCTPAGCVDLFGDYEVAEIGKLLPPLDKKSFKMLSRDSKALATFSTSIEPHFSGFALETSCSNCSSEKFGEFLKQNGAKNLEMRHLEGKSEEVWVANYQCNSSYFGALAYFRELLYLDGEQAFRNVFWTFDHPQTLKSETIRIFDTFYEVKGEDQ